MFTKVILILLGASATLLAVTERRNGDKSLFSIRSRVAISIAIITALCSIYIVYDETRNIETLQVNAISHGLLSARSSLVALDLSVMKLNSYDPTNPESPPPELHTNEHMRAVAEITELLATYSDSLSSDQRTGMISIGDTIKAVIRRNNELTTEWAGLSMVSISKQARELCETAKLEEAGYGLLCGDNYAYYEAGGYWAVIEERKRLEKKTISQHQKAE